jgi:hypothetical protein
MDSLLKVVVVLLVLNGTGIMVAWMGLDGVIDVELAKKIVFSMLLVTCAILVWTLKPTCSVV